MCVGRGVSVRVWEKVGEKGVLLVRFGLLIGHVLVNLLEAAHKALFCCFFMQFLSFIFVREGVALEGDGYLYFVAAIVPNQVQPGIGNMPEEYCLMMPFHHCHQVITPSHWHHHYHRTIPLSSITIFFLLYVWGKGGNGEGEHGDLY